MLNHVKSNWRSQINVVLSSEQSLLKTYSQSVRLKGWHKEEVAALQWCKPLPVLLGVAGIWEIWQWYSCACLSTVFWQIPTNNWQGKVYYCATCWPIGSMTISKYVRMWQWPLCWVRIWFEIQREDVKQGHSQETTKTPW